MIVGFCSTPIYSRFCVLRSWTRGLNLGHRGEGAFKRGASHGKLASKDLGRGGSWHGRQSAVSARRRKLRGSDHSCQILPCQPSLGGGGKPFETNIPSESTNATNIFSVYFRSVRYFSNAASLFLVSNLFQRGVEHGKRDSRSPR